MPWDLPSIGLPRLGGRGCPILLPDFLHLTAAPPFAGGRRQQPQAVQDDQHGTRWRRRQRRNNASIHYYFGSKDALLDELILDCAHWSDNARVQKLDELEATGGPRTIVDVVRLIVEVETTPRRLHGEDAMSRSSGHMRFVMSLKINHRRAFMQAMAGHKTSGYLRCIEHIYHFLPDVPKSVLNQRLIFMDLFLGATLAAREAAFEHDPTGGKLWSAPNAIENLIQSACSLLNPHS